MSPRPPAPEPCRPGSGPADECLRAAEDPCPAVRERRPCPSLPAADPKDRCPNVRFHGSAAPLCVDLRINLDSPLRRPCPEKTLRVQRTGCTRLHALAIGTV